MMRLLWNNHKNNIRRKAAVTACLSFVVLLTFVFSGCSILEEMDESDWNAIESIVEDLSSTTTASETVDKESEETSAVTETEEETTVGATEETETEAEASEDAKVTTEAETEEETTAEAETTETTETEKEAVHYEFRKQKYWEEHFEKHGGEFDYANKEEYLEGANRVINDPNALHKTEKEDGDYVYYLEESNEFVILSKDGYIRTYFKPSAGLAYYERQ